MKPDKRDHEKKEDHSKGISRRGFIRFMQCAGAGAFLGLNKAMGQSADPARPPAATPSVPYMNGHVVHVRDEDATFWDFSTGWYGYYVDQDAVDTMVETGLKRLTASSTAFSAWSKLVPGYTPGQTFAIKVNFNNFSHSGPDPDPEINALIEPVNALIRTLIMFNVQPEDITVYDVTYGYHSGSMPQISFINRCLYPGINFVYHTGNPNPFSSTEFVKFNPPTGPGVQDLAIGNVVVDTDYLINMFIPKGHSLAGVTLGFKNHLGSITDAAKPHAYMPYNYYYNPSYSTYIDIFKNRNFGPKTVLTMCDGLFGNWIGVHGVPKAWKTFNDNSPSSLFFAADPVAIDSVLTDYVEIERKAQGYGSLMAGTRDYLVLAEGEEWGIHEQADPWVAPIGSDYKRIQYTYVVL